MGEHVTTNWNARVGQVVSRWSTMWKSLDLILKEWSPRGASLFFPLHFTMLPQTFRPTQSLVSDPTAATQLPCRTAGLGPGAAFYSLSPAASDNCLSGVMSKLPFHGRPAMGQCLQSTSLRRLSCSPAFGAMHVLEKECEL